MASGWQEFFYLVGRWLSICFIRLLGLALAGPHLAGPGPALAATRFIAVVVQ